MSNEMITQLPTVGSASLSDIIYAVQGYVSPSVPGLSVQETLQQVYNLFLSGAILTYAGNPNGNVAGNVYTLCWDSSHSLLYVCTTTGSSSTAVWTPCIGQLTTGQVLIGSTGQPPVAATLTAGTGVAISNGAGSITISSTGGGTSWTNVTGTAQSMAVNSGYVAASSSGRCVLTLPTTASLGAIFNVQGLGSSGWQIAQNTGQQIALGSSLTTSGVGGSLASTNQYDSISLLCVVADTLFTALTAPQGIITIV